MRAVKTAAAAQKTQLRAREEDGSTFMRESWLVHVLMIHGRRDKLKKQAYVVIS